ncbi:hypothetical protein AVEN_160136-1 [Araneus ventricosus]|uniref:Uncharacterized protein n=1 Tax=Araneus ventricosus TaxID=182803 RepID=A0A4Y2VV94_ARAVE|nr:hypothetical protein AVEN_160136-1 [Araneus ventricosus]
MQDGTSKHIAYPDKRLLSMDFGNNTIISHYFPTNWPPRSPNRNPCDFWLKRVVFSGPIANLAELKTRIKQHIQNISTHTHRSVEEHAISRFELAAENGGYHSEHFFSFFGV